MSKICMILASNVYAMPFFYKYQKIIQDANLSADLIYWNRDGINEKAPCNINYIPYNKKSTYNDGNKKKILEFLLFAQFVKKEICQRKYDKIIFLGNYGATHVLLSGFLKRKYKYNYWMDYRDYNYEGNKLYLLFETAVINNSYATAISSEGYKEFLPPYNYIIVHNIDLDSINECRNIPHVNEESIRISFIGNVRYLEENKKLLNALKNDERFIMQFYGSGSDVIKEYCDENKITNVDFYGRFPHEKTAEFYSKTDIINNIYGNQGIELKTALSNKLYFAASLEMPILVCSDTYMESVSTKYGFGFTFDSLDPDVSNKLFDFYMDFQVSGRKGCKEFIQRVTEEELSFKESLIRYIKG